MCLGGGSLEQVINDECSAGYEVVAGEPAVVVAKVVFPPDAEECFGKLSFARSRVSQDFLDFVRFLRLWTVAGGVGRILVAET
jgi:hypothetical protein